MKNKYSNFVLTIIHKLKRSQKRTGEEEILIRHTRLRRFKKPGRKWALIAQIVAIWYLSIISVSYLTSDTGAYFNDVEIIDNYLHVGTWENPDDGTWEKSSLEEAGQRGNCVDGIFASFTNTGENVDHELTTYEVYWSEEEGSVKNGEVVETGTFPMPDNGEVFEIHFQPTKNGFYKFKAYHETGHANGNNGDDKGPWSGTLHVMDCEVTPTDQPVTPVDDGNEDPNPTNTVDQSEITNLNHEITNNSITLTWSNPTNSEFAHVKIYRNDQLIKDSYTETTLVDENLTPSTEYVYKITVYANGIETPGTSISVKTNEDVVDETPPGEVTDLKGERINGASGHIKLNWNNPTESDYVKTRIYIVGDDDSLDPIEGDYTTSFEQKFEKKAITFKITTIDSLNNESEGLFIKIE